MRRCVRRWAAALMCAWAAPLSAQTSGAEALHERLSAASSVADVEAVARQHELGDAALARGLVALRRHDLTREMADAQMAYNSLLDAARRDTTSAWAFYGIGRIVDDRPAVLNETPGSLDALLPPRRMAGAMGFEPRSRAQQALLRAVELDPTLAEAALRIADMAVVSRDDAELEIAARSLSRVAEADAVAPEVNLALSRVRTLMADASAANAAAMQAMAGGAEASLSLLSSARALLPSPVTEERGAQAYLQGTRVLTDETAARYFDDVQQVLRDEQRHEWRELPLDEQGAWLRSYWDVRAALAGMTVPRTLGLHYRRVLRADRLYGGQYGEPTPAEELTGAGEHFPHTVAADFAEELELYYDFYAFRGDSGRTAVTVALVVPVLDLQPILADSSVIYGVRVSAIAVDSMSGLVSRVDTIQYYRSPRLLPEDGFLRTYVELQILPSDHTVYRLVVRDAARPRRGKLYGGPLDVPSFPDTELALSDVVVTAGGAGEGRWQRGELTLPLTPAVAYEENSQLTLFYEIYGLAANAPYRTEIRIEPTSAGLLRRLQGALLPGSAALNLSFDAVAPADGGAVREVRTFQTELDPDEYRVSIRVTDLAGGAEASRSREVTFVEEE